MCGPLRGGCIRLAKKAAFASQPSRREVKAVRLNGLEVSTCQRSERGACGSKAHQQNAIPDQTARRQVMSGYKDMLRDGCGNVGDRIFSLRVSRNGRVGQCSNQSRQNFPEHAGNQQQGANSSASC